MNYDVVSRPGCCDCWVRLVLRSKVVVSALGMGQVTYDHMKGNNNPAIPAILGQRTRVLIQYLRSGEVVDGKGKSPAVEGLTGAVGEEGFRNLHVEPIGCLPCQCQNVMGFKNANILGTFNLAIDSPDLLVSVATFHIPCHPMIWKPKLCRLNPQFFVMNHTHKLAKTS